MLPSARRHALPAVVLAVCGSASAARAERPIDFDADVRPILSDRCVSCHGPDPKKRSAGLRLDVAAGFATQLDDGRAVEPGHPERSVIMQRMLAPDPDDRMPPVDTGKTLNAQELEIVRRWIAEGASWKPLWSFAQVTRPAPPQVTRKTWPRNAIDRFILDRLEREGIEPSAEADRATLIRRVSLDLIGLPPTPGEIDAFVADRRADAYERVVDRLLASPHYGERWARPWLDLARYADSNGYSIDGPRSIWKYRDWVVDALNRDLPYDQFVIEQLAGDLLPNATIAQRIATGFHRNTPLNEEGGVDREQYRVEAVADRVATTGAAFMGLTLGCARCHDHKFDPVTQEEFFRLYAFFDNVDEPVLELAKPTEIARAAEATARVRAAQGEVYALEKKWLEGLPPERKAAVPAMVAAVLALGPEQRDPYQWRFTLDHLRRADAAFDAPARRLSELTAAAPKHPTTLVMAERSQPRETHVHIAGDFSRPGAIVTPGVPAVLPALTVAGGRRPNRLDLARWLVDPRHPLTARVAVNRLWQQHFGAGLVTTDDDFGAQGARPSHPELLDWLASELTARRFSVKAMRRLIVTSATYRQTSHARPDLAERDPGNRLLARQRRLRLDAEIIRDESLAVSGLLDHRVGGPPVFPPQPDGVFGFTQIPRVWIASTGSDRHRRGLYTHLWRSASYPAFAVFDAPDGQAACTRRARSTTPLQALTLLNGTAADEAARALASPSSSGDARTRIARLFRRALGRRPAANELDALVPLVQPHAKDDRAYHPVARALLNTDEFITRE